MNVNRQFYDICYLDGAEEGIVRCEFGPSQYVAYRIPRRRFEELRQSRSRRDDPILAPLEFKGIYLLISQDDKLRVRSVYVGQAGGRANEKLGVLNRIYEHRKDRYKAWDEVVILTTVGNTWEPTELSYLENRFFSYLSEELGDVVCNSTTPSGAMPTHQQRYALDLMLEDSSPKCFRLLGVSLTKHMKIRRSGLKPKKVVAHEAVMTVADSSPLQKAFTFSAAGVPVGAALQFVEGHQVVTVIDDKHVSFEGKPYSLSGFVREFIPTKNNSGAYQGPKYFTYNGKLLSELCKASAAVEAPQQAAPKSTAAVSSGGWKNVTQLAKFVAKQGGNEGAAGGILQLLTGKRRCTKTSKWRKPLEDVGVRFDAMDMVVGLKI